MLTNAFILHLVCTNSSYRFRPDVMNKKILECTFFPSNVRIVHNRWALLFFKKLTEWQMNISYIMVLVTLRNYLSLAQAHCKETALNGAAFSLVLVYTFLSGYVITINHKSYILKPNRASFSNYMVNFSQVIKRHTPEDIIICSKYHEKLNLYTSQLIHAADIRA